MSRENPIPEQISAYFSRIGKIGGKKCLETMSPRMRKARAKKAIAARWEKARKAS